MHEQKGMEGLYQNRRVVRIVVSQTSDGRRWKDLAHPEKDGSSLKVR